MIKSHYPIAELLQFGLQTVPKTRQGLEYLVAQERWAYIEVKAKGGRGGVRREYQPSAAVMAAIKQVALANALKDAPAAPAPASVAAVIPSDASPLPGAGVPVLQTGTMTVATQAGAELKDWQKRTAEARAAILLEIDRLAGIVGREKAIAKVIELAADGLLAPHLMQLVPLANARAGSEGKRTLSRATIYEWFAAFKGRSVNALAPKDQYAVTRIPAWASDLLAAFQRPQKPSLAWAVEQVAQLHGLDAGPFYHRARRFLEKMGNVEVQAGRRGARDIKNIKPFVRRDSGTLWPADVYSADGHAFDAEVAHPAHGRPFRPEITSVRDIATRRLIGWSVDLAESGLAVLDAIRHACETGGICSIFYVDHGSGFDNALQSAPGIGMESRLGYTKTHSLPYNSQARGVVEKGHKDIWVRAAKELPTYMGADMDAEAKNKVFKLTRGDIKESGVSRHLMPWTTFLQFVQQHADKYNNRPHRSLKKVYDAALGRQRHMTPNEAWAEGVSAGAELVAITPDESRELFRPQKEAKVLRGEIKLFGNLYFSHELTEYHGDIVRVAYDIHNAHLIWIYDQQGRFVCTAEFEANKRAYFPDSFVNQAARKRAVGRANRLERKLEEVQQELAGTPLVIENAPSPTLADLVVAGNIERITPKVVNLDSAAALDVHVIEAIEPVAPGNARPVEARPVFFIESERYEWLMQNRDAWSDTDHKFLTDFVSGDIYRDLSERFELLGIAWPDDGGVFLKVAV